MIDDTPARIGVLASGDGTNLQAILDDPVLRPLVHLVVSDRPGSGALVRATRAGIAADVVRWRDHSSRSAFSAAVADVLEAHRVDLVVLAGFMRILDADMIARFPGRILNVHPSLLPAFPGADAVEQALEHGVKVTGVTVHIVEEAVDSGPILAQEAVPVESDDDVSSLHHRIQKVEHQLFPDVIRSFVAGRFLVEGRKVVRT